MEEMVFIPCMVWAWIVRVEVCLDMAWDEEAIVECRLRYSYLCDMSIPGLFFHSGTTGIVLGKVANDIL